MKLKKYKLGEIGKIVTGKTPRTAIIENYGGDVPFLTPTDDLSAQYVGRTNKTLSPKGINEVKNCLLPPNTICVSCIGSNLGEVVITKEPTVTNQQFNSIIIHPQFDAQYIYYVLTLQKKQLQIIGNSATAVPIINKTTFENYEVVIHDNIADQRRIASVLSNLDRKIALNRQINTNLEALARQLYDYWFVQFDFPDANGNPYKSSGGKMTYNEKLKREIPDGWHCGNLYEIATFKNGLACQKFRLSPNGDKLPVIKIKEMHDGFTNETEFVKVDIPESAKVYNGDVLFSWSASLEVMIWSFGKGGLNQHIFKVTSANGFPKSFYYFQLLDYVHVFKAMAEARKTTMGHITTDHLEQSTIAIPNNTDIANKFEKEVAPILNLIISNQAEISSLTRQRDELLPLLMNGQVSVE